MPGEGKTKISNLNDKKIISIVVPVFNEEDNLKPLYNKIKEVFGKINYDFELILVESGSSDKTLDVSEELHRIDPRVKFLSLSYNFGHQVALSAGIDYAEGSAVVLMDADLQHPPETIPKLVEKWCEGYENVYTIRKTKGNVSFAQKYFSEVFYNVFRAFTKLDLPMNSADFRLLDRRLVLCFRKIRERNRFLRGLIAWTGFKSVGVEYVEDNRFSGKTKYNFKRKLVFAIDAIVSFTNKPLYIGILIGVIFAFFGLIYFLYALYINIFTGMIVPGWASIVSLLSVLGGIQLIVMGLIGIYIGKIFEEVKQRPLYFIQHSRGFDESKLNN